MRRFWKFATAVLSGVLFGCSAPATPGGRLIIAGGATSPDNAEVYGKFMEPLPPDAMIGVLPTASGVPDSGESSAKTLRRYADTRRVEVIDITAQTAARASENEYVERIRRCNAIWFTGGDQSRIVDAFRPKSGDTSGYLAARHVLEKGGVVGGTSAGAAMMSDPMITGGRSDDALLGKIRVGPEDAGFGIGTGMGFFPFGLTDQHFLRRGRLGRLVVGLEMSGLQRGYGIDENCAMQVDLASGLMTALGPTPAVIVVDVREEKREGLARRGIRVSMLNDGDSIDAASGAIRILPTRQPLKSATSSSEPLPAAWEPGAVGIAMNRLASSSPVELRSASFLVSFRSDDQTHFFAAANDSDRITVVHAVLDILPLPQPQP